jgi:hypothetical protein
MAQWTTTYDELLDLLGTYVEDDSTEFASHVQGFINRAEERVLRDIDLAIWNVTTTSSTSDAETSFVKAFGGAPINSIWVSCAGVHLERRSLPYIQSYGSTGCPRYFYEDATRVYWAPIPDAAYQYSLTYYARPSPLTSSNQTNWITDNLADLLLWAALIESEAFLLAPERVQEFEGKYQQMLGPARAFWREQMQLTYEPVNPTPQPVQTR